MPKSQNPSRSLEIIVIWTFDTEFPTIFDKSCTFITFKSAVKLIQLGYGIFIFIYCIFLGTDTQSMTAYLYLSYFPGKKLVDGKGIGGRVRLTSVSERIDYFQCMYGRALRSDPDAMARATLAILSHHSTPDHTKCPSGEGSWLSTGCVAVTTPPTNLLPPAIVEIIKLVFMIKASVRSPTVFDPEHEQSLPWSIVEVYT